MRPFSSTRPVSTACWGRSRGVHTQARVSRQFEHKSSLQSSSSLWLSRQRRLWPARGAMRVAHQHRRRELRVPRGSPAAGGALLLLMIWSPGASAFQPGASLLQIRRMGPSSILLQGRVPGGFCPPSVLSSGISRDSLLADKGCGNGGGDAGLKRTTHDKLALEMSTDGGVRGGVGARPSSPSSSPRRSFLQLLLGGASATALGSPLRSDAAPPRTVAWPPFAPSPGATVSKDGEPWPRDRARGQATAGQEGKAILRR